MTTSAHRSINRHVIIGLATILFLFAGVGGWAATTPLSGAVVASGSLVVDSNVKPVQHPTGGIVAEIFVEDGDRVEAAAVLARLDDTETRANLAIIENRLSELTVRSARLAAERDGSETVTFPATIFEVHENPTIASLVVSELRLLEARRALRSGQIAQLEEKITQYRNEIGGLEAQIRGKGREIVLVEGELEGLRTLLASGIVTATRVNTLERNLASLEGEKGVLMATIARLEGQIAETRLQILQIDSQLQSEVGQEIAQVRAEIMELSERRIAALEQLRRIDIRAPQAGLVHDLSVHIAGAVIGEGVPIMSIVPVDETLVVEVRMQPQDIDQVYYGQSAMLRFSAFNQRTTPEIAGTVSRIGADLTVDQSTGLGFYLVRIKIGEEEMGRLGSLALVPGMPVEAFIETDQRTALSYLVKPLVDQIARAFREE